MAIKKCSLRENFILKFLNLQKHKIIIEAKKNDNIKKLLDAFDDADLINVQKDDN